MGRIDRKKVVKRHNPILTAIDYESPLTVGNGFFAYTFDITGMQSLGRYYARNRNPLCTMAEWGWHTTPFGTDKFACSFGEVEMTEYDFCGRKVAYAAEKKEGNEEVYEWLRHNPHRYSLAEVGLLYDGKEIMPEDIGSVRQELDLFEGTAESEFEVGKEACSVMTACGDEDCVGFSLRSQALKGGKIKVRIRLPYPGTKICGADWEAGDRHTTELLQQKENSVLLVHRMDRDACEIRIGWEGNGVRLERAGSHEFLLSSEEEILCFSLCFRNRRNNPSVYGKRSQDALLLSEELTVEEICMESRRRWGQFWQKGGMVDLEGTTDVRGMELERRIILSLYLTGLQCTGYMPPQETGLTCNSWYGKSHLEMHLWHAAYLPLWHRGELLERSIPWYTDILDKAKENAARNGYAGARWPKMVSCDGMESPSVIATLLIWQQPHILYMLELLYQEKKEQDENEAEAFLERMFGLVKETADFMADFAVENRENGEYDLLPPIIPAQERHAPQDTVNPAFEVEYWRFGLSIAVNWAKRKKEPHENYALWEKVGSHMAKPPVSGGLYIAHQHCPDTFLHYNTDHPSMLGALGLLPGEGVDCEVMKATLDRVLECWDFDSMWGWDFAMMAMTAVRLGCPELAVDLLLMDKPKNSYVASGNNYQKTSDKLPLYLPGNGSLLLAVPLMLEGIHAAGEDTEREKGRNRGQETRQGEKGGWPGFPGDGSWKIRYEDISGFPY